MTISAHTHVAIEKLQADVKAKLASLDIPLETPYHVVGPYPMEVDDGHLDWPMPLCASCARQLSEQARQFGADSRVAPLSVENDHGSHCHHCGTPLVFTPTHTWIRNTLCDYADTGTFDSSIATLRLVNPVLDTLLEELENEWPRPYLSDAQAWGQAILDSAP